MDERRRSAVEGKIRQTDYLIALLIAGVLAGTVPLGMGPALLQGLVYFPIALHLLAGRKAGKSFLETYAMAVVWFICATVVAAILGLIVLFVLCSGVRF